MAVKWLGEVPQGCQLCSGPFNKVMYDSRTRDGRWGLLCKSCWQDQNGQVGTGFAQKYELGASEVWWKTEG